MIYLMITLDVIINNYTKYTSFFFIIYLYNKSYKYFLLTGLILDLIIFNTFFINTLILSIMFMFNKIFKDLNKKNILNYLFITIFNYILFILLSNTLASNDIKSMLILLGKNLVINILFYLFSFKKLINCKM